MHTVIRGDLKGIAHTRAHAQTNMQTRMMKTQFLFKLRQPRCQTFDSGWGVPSPEIKTTRKKNKKTTRREKKCRKKKGQKKGKKSSVVLPDGNAMLTFPFVVSPSRVESQNSRTTAMRKKKLTRRRGESGSGSWKGKGEQRRSWRWGDLYSGAECSTQNTQTTRFMQEAEGRSAYYVVEHNVQVKEISIWL